MTRMGARVADGMMFGDLTIHRAAEVMANIEAGAAKRGQPADDFRIGNYWAWHVKKDRERSMYEARRSLVWRTQLVPPFHGLDLLLEEDEAQLVRDNFDNFAKARELEKAGFTDLALKIFDDPMDNVQTICERVIPNVA
jgi:alkanesulfonate monooxygenase SsuD/methylene tetrahydromethanopterin reductase-like flavin-dependent oxidoreductase (luciferase family)